MSDASADDVVDAERFQEIRGTLGVLCLRYRKTAWAVGPLTSTLAMARERGRRTADARFVARPGALGSRTCVEINR